jgi:D-proline reductase (dithiol) PrdB
VNALARTFEASGLPTVVVNIMPVWGERFGAPRTLGVEFPFGHTLGPPDDAALQTRVIRAALDLLVTAQPPGPVIAHFDEPWPGDFDEWKRAWHPKQPSPVIKWMREQAEARARERRQDG